MVNSIHRALCLGLFLTCVLLFSHADAAIQTQPTSLNPGDQYRLVFVTSTGGSANSSVISDYNQVVTNAANAVAELSVLGVQWTAIASTTSVNARDNTGTDPTPAGATGVPIFLLNDTLFAANYDDLWDGSPAGTSINITEKGDPFTPTNHSTINGWVWTGSDDSGFGIGGQELGAFSSTRAFGDATPEGGIDVPGGPDGWMLDGVAHVTHTLSFYAMSGILTIPGDPNVVPEATSFLVWGGLALTALGNPLSRRRRD